MIALERELGKAARNHHRTQGLVALTHCRPNGLKYSRCVRLEKSGRVAQLVEQCPFKAWVAGSNPAALTKLFNSLAKTGSVFREYPDKFPRKQLGIEILFLFLRAQESDLNPTIQQLCALLRSIRACSGARCVNSGAQRTSGLPNRQQSCIPTEFPIGSYFLLSSRFSAGRAGVPSAFT
jgi:hypothetical protein